MAGVNCFRVTTAIEAKSALEAATAWYDDCYNQEAIVEVAHEVRNWLIKNRQHSDEKGSISTGPWFPLQGLDYTEDEARLDLRRSGLRQKLFGHGLRYMIVKLIEEQMLPDNATNQIKMATSFQMMALHEQMMGFTLSPNPAVNGKTVNLVELRDIFDMSPDTNTSKIRNGRLIVMSSLGLWRGRVDDEGRYAIKIGLVARTFHEEVFLPVLRHFEGLISGANPETESEG